MIEIVCDNCERTFDVDPERAGEKVACPTCGDVNRVPREGDQPPPPPDPAAKKELPAVGGPEQEVVTIRPAMFRAHPLRYAFLIILFVAGIVLAILASRSEKVWPWVIWPGLLISVASLAWFATWWIGAHWWVKLVISNKRTVRHEGIIRRHTTEVLHDHVRSVDIRQSFLQRLLKVGSIGIDSAGQEGIEIQVGDLPDPYRIKALIDRYRRM